MSVAQIVGQVIKAKSYKQNWSELMTVVKDTFTFVTF